MKESKKIDELESALPGIVALLKTAKDSKMWIFNRREQVYFTADELENNMRVKRIFRWGIINWELLLHATRIESLNEDIAEIQEEISMANKRMAVEI